MRNFKRIVSILLSLALLLSAISVSFTVSAETVDGIIVNGDFEEGQKGFLNAEDADMNVKVYDNSDTTRPGYGTVTLDGKAAYIPGGSTKNEHLQFKIENLPAGTYTIKMDALVNVTDASVWAALGFGITDTIYSVAGIAYGNPMINNTAKATKNGDAVTVNSINTYHRLAGSTLTAGLHDTDVEISFSIAETKTLYLFMFSGATANAYIDNIVLERVSENGVINNGDFEEGQKGFLNAEDADMNVKVYDNSDTTRPGYGDVNLDGKAAYLPSMSETAKTNLLQYRIDNLPAGTYTIRMDALVSVTDPNVWSALGFGLTDTIWSTGVAYGPNMISNTAKATKNGSAITVNSTAVYHRLAGSTLSAGWSDADVEISFSIAETKTLYLFMFSGATVNAYIDNIVLERVSENGVINNGDFEEGQKGFLNAEDADMNVKVYDNSDTTRPGYGDVNLDGKAAYLPSMSETAKTNLLQYRIDNLPEGTYTIRMDALVSVTDPNVWSALGFGLTDTIWSTGVAYGPNMISNTAKATKNGSAITVNSTAVYHRLAGSTLTAGWSDVDVEISFSIAETKTLYLFMFSGATANAYIDNIVLERVSENGVINNGDFEEGQKGFLNAEDADMNVKVYDNSDTTRPGYGDVNLDGKAAYIPGGSTKNEHLQFKIQNLPAGTYTIKMDALVNVTDASVWAALGFGITDTIYSVAGIAYGNPMINNTAKATKNGDAVTVNSINTYHRLAGSTLTAGLHDTDVEISFSIAETKTLYLFMFSGATANAYIDNIVLERVSENGVINNGDFEEGQKGFLNAEDADMNVKVYDNSDTTRPGYGDVNLDGKAAYLPSMSETAKTNLLQYRIDNLPAGKYTISMDALVKVNDVSAWSALGFGITDTIYSVAGFAYGNNMIRNTAKATKNGSVVTVNSTAVYHRLSGNALASGWSDVDVEITFEISETKTLYLFVFAGGENKSNAYIDNIELFKSATINYYSINAKGGTIARANFTDYNEIGSIVSKERPIIENYSFIGYKVGLEGEIIADNVYKTTVETDADIYFMYALRGDLNDDLSTNALDLLLLRKYLLGIDTECNLFGARVNNIDEIVDIRDLVALKKKTIGMGNVLIFGDSYSTFYDYIPYGYSHYYGGGLTNTDVTKVEETWWHQVIEETDSNLILNDSWSGSTISHTGLNNTDTSKTSSFVYRLNKYVTEGFFEKNKIDTVYLFGGTNDSFANSPIGQLQFADWKEEDLFSFLPAMCYFLNTLKEVAPDAEIVCIINSDLKAEISEGMVAACEHYGVAYVQLENIDKVGSHPTVNGMTQIKDAVLGNDR